MTDKTLPTTVFYAETGGKSAPFYLNLGGVKSALKTSWRGRWNRYDREAGRPEQYPRPPVYKGTVTWVEIDPETGSPRE